MKSHLQLAVHDSGGGVHQWDVPVEKVIRFAKQAYVAEIFYGPVAFCAKLAILLMFNRIFGAHVKFLWATRVLIAFMILYYIPGGLVKIFICTPIEHFWNPESDGNCLDENTIFLADCIVSIISDFSILVLPLPIIWGLKTNTRRKIGLSITFAAGGLACAASIMRLYGTVTFGDSLDKTYVLIPILLWSIAEVNIGIICGCLPILPILLRTFYCGFKKSLQGSSTPYYKLDRSKLQSWPERKATEESKVRVANKSAGFGESMPMETIQTRNDVEDAETTIWAGDRPGSESSVRRLENSGIVKTVSVDVNQGLATLPEALQRDAGRKL